jgi:hypothetical protein
MKEFVIENENMTVKQLIDELKVYPSDTRLDFRIVDKDWDDCNDDPLIHYFGIVGSGEQTDDCEKGYIEVAFQMSKEDREHLKEKIIDNDEEDERSNSPRWHYEEPIANEVK